MSSSRRLDELERALQTELLPDFPPVAPLCAPPAVAPLGAIWHPDSLREYAVRRTVPGEHMLARQAVPPHGAGLFEISAVLRLCLNTGRFEFAAAEAARARGSNQPPVGSCRLSDHSRRDYRSSARVTGRFELVANDRYTCALARGGLSGLAGSGVTGPTTGCPSSSSRG